MHKSVHAAACRRKGTTVRILSTRGISW